jgi:hypothetical protein
MTKVRKRPGVTAMKLLTLQSVIASEAWIANDQGRGVRLRLLGAEVG